jgi:hypothetical protein
MLPIRLTRYYLCVVATILVLASFTAILAPLDVIVTRLAIQRNYGFETESALGPHAEVIDMEKAGTGLSSETDSEESVVRYAKSSTDNPIVAHIPTFRLRQDKDLYRGFHDCITGIVGEEGWRVLYSGWWLAFLGTIYCY